MDAIKIRIQPKKLASGKCQVRFEAEMTDARSCYGYLLTESEVPVNEIMRNINERLLGLYDKDRFYHANLYKMQALSVYEQSFWVYIN